MVNAKEVWICGCCGTVSWDESDALSCHPPEQKYECERCEELHDTEKEANECCSDEENE